MTQTPRGAAGPAPLSLLVMRHSKTEQAAETDHVRRLTERGRVDAAAAGAWVASSGLAPGIILASTAARAEETAELVATVAGVRRVELIDELYGADGYEVLDIVSAHVPDELTSAMVIGHNPAIAQLGFLIQADGAAEVRFPTSGIGAFGFDVDSWAELDEGHGRLLASYTPGD